MIIYIIIFLIFIAIILIGVCIWIYRLFKLYKNGNRTSFWIQASTLTIIIVFVTWNLKIFPLSEKFHTKEKTELLTGKSFWSSEIYSYKEFGNSYTIDIFELENEIAEYFKKPDSEFFEKYPLELNYRENWTRKTWKKTPVIASEVEYLEHST